MLTFRPSVSRRAVSILLASVLVALVGISVRQQAKAATAPNVVLILTDDQRWDTLWAMPQVQSLIADHGVSFDNSFVVNPLCCPSRSTILTGEYSHDTGVYKNAPPYGGFGSFNDTSTVATWLHGAGYQTALMGKYLNGYKYANIIPPGWDRWFVSTTDDRGGFEYYNYTMSDQGTSVFYGSDPQDYSTDVLSGQADTWIRGADPTKPLFLEVATAAPHSPATPGPKYINSFDDLAPYRPPSFNELDASDKPEWVQQTALMNSSDIAATDSFRQDQYRTLLSVDDMVNTVVQALTDTGRLSNTMIVFASDNGYSWGEHRRWDRKSSPYENDTRVPLIPARTAPA
jgi:N-acetylglucosamine-6-sulfatase